MWSDGPLAPSPIMPMTVATTTTSQSPISPSLKTLTLISSSSSMRKRRSLNSSSSGSSAADIFVCFTSSSSSSASMRMSPGRPSLSASLSRKLRSSGSIKGAQSPMFPSATSAPSTSRKKRGCEFEAAEPSSPKVTCIGQVRVKSKKKKQAAAAAMMMARSRSRDASFRRSRSSAAAASRRGGGNGNQQRWMHQLPISICEALKSIGSEINCFSLSCGGGGEEKKVAVRDVREVRERKCEEEVVAVRRKEMEVDLVVEEVVVEEERYEEEVEKGRVSVCIPPKNALLLMRCRSDPVRMAALANKFWGSPIVKIQCEDEEEEEEPELKIWRPPVEKKETTEVEDVEVDADEDMHEGVVNVEKESSFEEVKDEKLEQVLDEKQEVSEEVKEGEEEVIVPNDALREKEIEVKERRKSTSCSDGTKTKEVVAKRRSVYSKEKKERRRHSFSVERESRRNSVSSEKEARRSSFSSDRKRWSFSIDKEELVPELPLSLEGKEKELDPPLNEVALESVEVEHNKPEETEPITAIVRTNEVEKNKGEQTQGGDRKRRELPDCLLLMMYEPKLSMEVSKETWVCSTDFMRWRPNHNPQLHNHSTAKGKVVEVEDGGKDKCNESSDKGREVAPIAQESTVHHPPTPPRPSPPLAPPSSVSGIDPKLLKSCAAAAALTPQAPYEPFVLTRCKSEPVRSSARLVPDCFWKFRHESQDINLPLACRLLH